MPQANAKQRVACYQFAPKIADPSFNLEQSLKAMSEAAERQAKLLVLPELALSGNALRDREEAFVCSMSRDGTRLNALADQARALDLIVIAGFCERLEAGHVANTSVMIQPNGQRTFYRKAHLWNRETLIFTPGDCAPPVVQTSLGRVAMMLSYDLQFPEWVRLAALSGAQLLCAPVNWPASPRPALQRPVEVTRVQANAAVNHLFILACDRCGHERGMDWVAGSTLVGADGYLLAGGISLDRPQLLVADIKLRTASDKRIPPYNDILGDRRPQLYGKLCQA